jgi:hypothetical protein
MLRCRVCGARFALEDFPEAIDDALEALLASVPCDRV